ncbi:hypothetical protein D9M70_548210 [compost metagenome]
MQHGLQNGLGEKHRAAQVGGDDRVEILRQQVEKVTPDDRGDAGIVDEAADRAELGANALNGGAMPADIGKIGLDVDGPAAVARKFGKRLVRGSVWSAETGDGDVETVARKRAGNAEPDAAAAAGDDGDGTRR